MIHADYLFLLTDVDGLYTANPRKDPDARLIEEVESVSVIRNQGWCILFWWHSGLFPHHGPLLSEYDNIRV